MKIGKISITLALALLLALFSALAQAETFDVSIPEIPGNWNLTEKDALAAIEKNGYPAESNPQSKYVVVDSVEKDGPVYLAYMFENNRLKQAQKTLKLKLSGEADYRLAVANIENALSNQFSSDLKIIAKNENLQEGQLANQLKYLTDGRELIFLMYKFNRDYTFSVAIVYNNPNVVDINQRWALALDRLGFTEQK